MNGEKKTLEHCGVEEHPGDDGILCRFLHYHSRERRWRTRVKSHGGTVRSTIHLAGARWDPIASDEGGSSEMLCLRLLRCAVSRI